MSEQKVVAIDQARKIAQRNTMRSTMERKKMTRSAFDVVEHEFRDRYERLVRARNKEDPRSIHWHELHAKANAFFEAAVRICEEKRKIVGPIEIPETQEPEPAA